MVALEASELLLDSDIRNYVLVPILLVIFAISVLRHNMTLIFTSAPSKDLKGSYDAQIVTRLRRLMANGSRIPKSAFERRRAFFNHKDDGLLVIKSLPPTDKQELMPGLPSVDPSKLMQGQTSMMMSQLYMVFSYQIIDNMFSGFVAAKLPFSLTGGFKRMMHYGIDVGDLEVTYVSSSSWYLIIFSGLAQVTQILLGPSSSTMGATEGMMLPALNTQGSLFGNTESHDMFKKEKDLVDNLVHVSVTETSLARLPHRYVGHGKPSGSHHGHAH